MDSVFSSNEQEDTNLQSRKAPESEGSDENEEFDIHERLLFGGTSTTTAATADAGIGATIGKVGGSGSLARSTTDDLNLVSLNSIPGAKPETKTFSNTAEVQSNPLPALARTGTATSVSLQTASEDSAVPVRRRSGASDAVAVKLTQDSTPAPKLPADLNVLELDPAMKRGIAAMSANDLFDRLGKPPVAGTEDPVVTLAFSSRRAGTQSVIAATDTVALPVQTKTATTSIARPLADPAKIETSALPFTAPVPRSTSDVRITASGNVISTATSDNGTPDARVRATIASSSSPTEIAPLPRTVARTHAEGQNDTGMVVGTMAGTQFSATNDSGTPVFRRGVVGDQASIPTEQNRKATIGLAFEIPQAEQIKLAQTFNILPTALTPQTEQVRTRTTVATSDSTSETVTAGNTFGRSLTSTISNLVDRTRSTNADASVPTVVPMKHSDGTVLPTILPISRKDSQTVSPVPDGIGATVSFQIGARGEVITAPTSKDSSRTTTDAPQRTPETARNGLIAAVENLIPPAITKTPDQNTSIAAAIVPTLPVKEILRDGKIVETLQPGSVTNPTTNRVELPAGAKINEAGQIVDKTGRIIETSSNVAAAAANQIVSKPGDPIPRPGEVVTRPGEVVARPGEVVARPGELGTRAGEQITRPGEQPRTIDGVLKPNETGVKANELGIKPTDFAPRSTEAGTRIGEQIARQGELARTTNGAVKLPADLVARKDEVGGKQVDASGRPITDGTAKIDGGAKVADATGPKATELSNFKTAEAPFKAAEVTKANEVVLKTPESQAKLADAIIASGKQTDAVIKVSAEVAAAQKTPDAIARMASADVTAKSLDTARGADLSGRGADIVARGADANAVRIGENNAGRIGDAILKAADQNKATDSSLPLKLEGTIRANDQAIAQNIGLANANLLPGTQANQAGMQIAGKNESGAARIENAAARASEQNQIGQNQIGQNQIGQNLLAQNQLANQNQNAAVKGNDHAAAHGIKGAVDGSISGHKIDNAKIDQVVADILNNVRNNPNQRPELNAGKFLSQIDQANIAANQQLDPKGLLDAAAVRRILDGQGINLSPQAINTIMEGIKPTGEYAADYALPSIGSLNLSQIIGLGEKLQEAVAGAGNETAETQTKPQLQQHRVKYKVKEGDTLESIAQEKLGDARLFQLLITINRAQVNYKLEDDRKVAYVVPDQYLWLPTDHELDVHKKNFFGKPGKEGSFALGISSKQNTPLIPPVSFDRTVVSGEVSGNYQDFRPRSNSSNPLNPVNSKPENRISAGYEIKAKQPISKQNAQNISNTPSIPNVQSTPKVDSVNLDAIEFVSTQVSHRQCYQVRDGETLVSIAASLESMGHVSMWKLLAKINGFQLEENGEGKPVANLYAGQFIVLPTSEELKEYKILEMLNSCSKTAGGEPKNVFACVVQPREIAPPQALLAMQQGVGGSTTVHKLSSYTRLVLNDIPQLEHCFSITVEARLNGEWRAMASYECRHGQTTRHLYTKDGECKSMELELPPYVVKEMAKEDFIRNWTDYVNSYMGIVAERSI